MADFATSGQGYAVEADVRTRDRRGRPCQPASSLARPSPAPDASAAIHECVLAIKARVTVDTLAATIHAFPSTSRILNGLFFDLRRELAS